MKIDEQIKETKNKKEELEKEEKELEKTVNKLKKLGVDVKTKTNNFKKEVKKSLLTAIVAAFSFLIALSWRDLITEYVNLITKVSPIQGQLISAIIVTFISVLGIIIVTRFLKEE